jgi:hypothetical protein
MLTGRSQPGHNELGKLGAPRTFIARSPDWFATGTMASASTMLGTTAKSVPPSSSVGTGLIVDAWMAGMPFPAPSINASTHLQSQPWWAGECLHMHLKRVFIVPHTMGHSRGILALGACSPAVAAELAVRIAMRTFVHLPFGGGPRFLGTRSLGTYPVQYLTPSSSAAACKWHEAIVKCSDGPSALTFSDCNWLYTVRKPP